MNAAKVKLIHHKVKLKTDLSILRIIVYMFEVFANETEPVVWGERAEGPDETERGWAVSGGSLTSTLPAVNQLSRQVPEDMLSSNMEGGGGVWRSGPAGETPQRKIRKKKKKIMKQLQKAAGQCASICVHVFFYNPWKIFSAASVSLCVCVHVWGGGQLLRGSHSTWGRGVLTAYRWASNSASLPLSPAQTSQTSSGPGLLKASPQHPTDLSHPPCSHTSTSSRRLKKKQHVNNNNNKNPLLRKEGGVWVCVTHFTSMVFEEKHKLKIKKKANPKTPESASYHITTLSILLSRKDVTRWTESEI